MNYSTTSMLIEELDDFVVAGIDAYEAGRRVGRIVLQIIINLSTR